MMLVSTSLSVNTPDDQDIAIAIAIASATPKPRPIAEAKLPEVYFIWADFKCPLCDVIKGQLKDWKPPFKPIHEVPNDPKFPKLDYYPMVVWKNYKGNWVIYDLEKYSWQGREMFLQTWKNTQVAPKIQTPKVDHPYEPVLGWPGTLQKHLTKDHGVSIDGLSKDQMERLHDQLHGK